jgi:endoglucanase
LISSATDTIKPKDKPDSLRILQESWLAYKELFVTKEGRVLGDLNTRYTTSEGQSYAMLRSVWMDDQATFDHVWGWTKTHLEKKHGGPFAWKWGECANSWKVIGHESASDADEDIALALIMATEKWYRPDLKKTARHIIEKIWQSEVVSEDGKAYLTAGDWAPKLHPTRINPSYFAPYAYRLFAKIDTSHNWLSLVDGSYDVLFQCSKQSQVGLPPDWCNLDPITGRVIVDPNCKDSQYSYDALRIPWRIAADWYWNNEPRAKDYLSTLKFIQVSLESHKIFQLGYSPSGTLCGSDEPSSSYGAMLPYLQITDPNLAGQVIQEKLMAHYDQGLWRLRDNYYDQNWVWFGLGLYWKIFDNPSI